MKRFIINNLKNIPGWRTNRKIVVFESDDWGGVRMSSKETFLNLLNSGIRVDLCAYNRLDKLESNEDYEALYDVLNRYIDYKGSHPKLTLNFNLVNPDFDRIKKDNFGSYHYVPFTQSLNEYYPKSNTFQYLTDGITQGLVYPQYHHREHVNPVLWLELLQKKVKPINTAFEHRVYGLSYITSSEIDVPYLASLLYRNEEEANIISEAIMDGARLFKAIFGWKPESFIAPLNTWPDEMESVIYETGVRFLQGGNVHKWFDFKKGRFTRKYHFLGRVNDEGITYMHRNCQFEPSVFGKSFDMGRVITEIESAFFWSKPAVICTHRLNYIGGLDETNRKQNLDYLNVLLKVIMKRWPDVEFMHSAQLGSLMNKCEHERLDHQIP
ncbi:MAG: hypothetical protein KF845_12115 [Cyclobacteriaceae bacterium]|nr:hypothetical protein [Cyclobacteriaceae bacterium]